jgi:hypothetical protein
VPHLGQVCAEVSVRSRPHFGHFRMDAIPADYSMAAWS